MREIKFRLWDNRSKYYQETHNTCKDYDTVLSLPDCLAHDILSEIDELDRSYIDSEHIEDYYKIEQYTGMKDDDGVEIYEGDVVQFGSRGSSVEVFRGTVEFFNYGWRIDTGTAKVGFEYLEPSFCKFKVIGNIHEGGGQ